MSTKEQIIELADVLIRAKGYNAFSFYDISEKVGIKTASIHYHFPSKSDLGVAVIEKSILNLEKVAKTYKDKSPVEKLERFFTIYSDILNEKEICIVGSLSTDFNTLDEKVQEKLKVFSGEMIRWVSSFLEEGRNQKIFAFEDEPRTRALLLITNMISIVQLSRLTGKEDFAILKDSIKKQLIR